MYTIINFDAALLPLPPSPLPAVAPPNAICTHIYPLQVAVGLRRGHHSIISVDDGHDVHAQQLLQCAVQVLPLVVIVEIQICHKDLTTQEGRRRELILSERERCKYVTLHNTNSF